MWIERWKQRQVVPDAARLIADQLNINPILAKLLTIRGITTPKEARMFLKPSLTDLREPFLMAGMEKAVTVFIRALKESRRITVVGDYDVDGVTSAALVRLFMADLDRTIEVVLPDRFLHGYGLTDRLLPDVLATNPGLVVTVDCGITAIEQVRALRDKGIDVIILDHHIPKRSLPPASAVVDPMLPDSAFPFKGMAAVGVTFYFLIALRRALREAGWFKSLPQPGLESYLDIVALGTIADSVPLIQENRVFALRGLEAMQGNRARPAIKALKAVASLRSPKVRAGHVGFVLGPRLNAAGRLSTANKALELLCAKDEVEAVNTARELNELNETRQDIQSDVLEAAIIQVETRRLMEHNGIVVAGKDWHTGVTGIVASRLVELYNRPCIVISLDGDTAKGSCRSVPGFDITLQGLHPLRDMLTAFGGHSMAAGLSLPARDVEAFSRAFTELCDHVVAQEILQPVIRFDLDVDLDQVDMNLVHAIQRMEPFGYGNPEPVIVARSVMVQTTQVVGRNRDTLVLKGKQASSRHFRFVGFRWLYEVPTQGSLIDIAFSCDISDYNHEVYGKIKALRVAQRPNDEDVTP